MTSIIRKSHTYDKINYYYLFKYYTKYKLLRFPKPHEYYEEFITNFTSYPDTMNTRNIAYCDAYKINSH